jgi:hypothetical protein
MEYWDEKDGFRTSGSRDERHTYRRWLAIVKGKGQGDMHRRIISSNIKHSQSCSETTLTGESQFHKSTPMGFEPGSLMTGSKWVDHWTSGTVYDCSEIAGSLQSSIFWLVCFRRKRERRKRERKTQRPEGIHSLHASTKDPLQ